MYPLNTINKAKYSFLVYLFFYSKKFFKSCKINLFIILRVGIENHDDSLV